MLKYTSKAHTTRKRLKNKHVQRAKTLIYDLKSNGPVGSRERKCVPSIVSDSVTRFGEILKMFGNFLWVYLLFGKISPLWLNFKSVWQLFSGLFKIWQNFESTFAKCLTFEQFFMFTKGQILTNK